MGPNDGENSLISYQIREFKAGISPQLTKCEQMWDYLYADDVADAILAVAEKGVDIPWDVLMDVVSKYVEDIKGAINPSIEVQSGAMEYFPHQPMHHVADIRLQKEDTGRKPSVSFVDGIKKILI